jgi:hypothetical protein
MARRDPDEVFQNRLREISRLARGGIAMSVEDARSLIDNVGLAFKHHLEAAGISETAVRAIRTKFRDAGRRSAPWRPTSSRVPGRPQDGSDGNRINRWLLPEDHKFYATELDATMVEVRYFLQTWSMTNAPALPADSIQQDFPWLVDHPVEPGRYRDPIQLCQIDLNDFVADRRSIQSAHLMPLDRGGRHVPHNAFLMLARSNQLQGNLTLDELVALMNAIVERHVEAGDVSPTAVAGRKRDP